MYPNFAVDMAARIPYSHAPAARKVRAFLMKYQDRVLYATDLVVFPRSKTEDTSGRVSSDLCAGLEISSDAMRRSSTLGKTYQGLALPRPVLTEAVSRECRSLVSGAKIRRVRHDNCEKLAQTTRARGSANP